MAYAANLLGLPLPPEIPFEQAELSPMAKSFYADSKKVSNQRIKTELGYKMLYPNYRKHRLRTIRYLIAIIARSSSWC